MITACNPPEVPLRRQQSRHDSQRRRHIVRRAQLVFLSDRIAPREEGVPEGWGRLSLVCPQETPGAPSDPQKYSPDSSLGLVNRRLKAIHRNPEKTHSLPLPPTASLSHPPVASSNSSSGSLDSSSFGQGEMSGGGGIGGSATSYSTLRRGFKATTSKLMGATSVKRPTHIPPAFDRGPGSERSDPGRFIEGVSFKGKLIGVLEVAEARGDRMCQEALAELKTAVRAAGEHKQRIAISVAMDGIRLTDERTGDCLHHHPVHKISFIAQDMTDTRAFGYIFGSPDAGHKFFGIKTEKAASQVVIAMRDLFQVVFERKKKEVEKARAQLEEGRDGSDFKEPSYGSLFGANGEPGIVSASLTSGAGGAIADLLDLQSELTSLQRGLSEISKRTQSLQKQQSQSKEEHFDPFGDSFKPGTSSTSSAEAVPKPPRVTASTAPTPAPLAPPPISGRSRHDSQKSQQKSSDFAKFPVDFKNLNKPPGGQASSDRYAVFKEINPQQEDGYAPDTHRKSVGSTTSVDSGKKEEPDSQWVSSTGERSRDSSTASAPNYDLFTELDPLGTGKIKPFVDKKDFFNDVRKQTARRLLRGMGDGEESLPGSPKVPPGVIPPEVSALVASSSLYVATSNPSTLSAAKPPTTSTHTTPVHGSVLPSFADSFGDSFGDHVENPSGGFVADFNQFTDSPRSQRSEFSSGSAVDEPPTSLSVGSLTVALPPESFRDSPPPFSPPPPPHSPARSTSGSNSPQPSASRNSPLPRSRLLKQGKIISSPLSPKTLPRSHKFPRQESYESSWDTGSHFPSPRNPSSDAGFSSLHGEGGISPRPRPRSSLSKHHQFGSGSATLPLRGSFGKGSHRGSVSPTDLDCRPFPNDDMNLSYDEAPEPPPRPAHVEPPPLPPKRLPSHITLRPPPRPPPSSEPHYDYINEYDSSPEDPNVTSPPIPIPARKPRHPETPTSGTYGSGRIIKPPSIGEGFQFPKASHSPTREFTGAVPKTSSRGSTPSKSSTPGKSPRGIQRGLTPESVDLTNTSLDQLASTLNVPVDQLAKMTVVELAACLAQLQLRNDGGEAAAPPRSDDGYEIPNSLGQRFDDRRQRKGSGEWSGDKLSFDDQEMFARFDAQFPKSPVDTPDFPPSRETKAKFPLGAPVSEDRYAVFRELSSSGKQKSVFDENLLTPQNSAEEEVSEVSSGTFKAPYRHDSLDQKSSLSDDPDVGPDLVPDRIDHECVTVFRSPDISEYENFAPDFECKFEDDFSAATLSERSATPVNSPPAAAEPSPTVSRSSASIQKSPFTDDFSKTTHVSLFTESGKFARISNDEKFVANFNDLPNSLGNGQRSSTFSTSSGRRSTSEKSPFEDDFSEMHIKQRTIDDSSIDDNVFDSDGERRCKRVDRASKRRSKKSSLDATNDSSSEKPRSPFDDDFSQRTSKYEVLRDLDAERSSPFEDHEDQKSIGSLQSIQEEAKSGFENRRSPYSGTLTPPSYTLRSRGPSRVSVGSEGSLEVRQSPFEDNFNPTIENGPKNVDLDPTSTNDTSQEDEERTVTESDRKDDSEKLQNGEDQHSDFADFEHAFQEGNSPFHGNSVVVAGEAQVRNEEDTEDKKEEKDVTFPAEEVEEEEEEEEEVVFPEEEPEFKVSARFPKSEGENIFRRDSDPFSDDFFDEEPLSEPRESTTASKGATDPFWEEPFANFKFNNG